MMSTFLEPRAWSSLVSGFWCEFLGGQAFTFAAYSAQLKHELKLTQRQLNTIVMAGDWGFYFVVVGALVLDYFGPRWCIALGVFLGVVFNLASYIVTLGWLPPNVWFLSALFFFAWQGFGCLDFTAIKLETANFPLRRGISVGVVQTMLGMSSGIVTQVDKAFFADSGPGINELLYFAAMLLLYACPMVALAGLGPTTDMHRRGFVFAYGIVVVLLCLLVCGSVLSLVDNRNALPDAIIAIGLMLVVPMFAIVIPVAHTAGYVDDAIVAEEAAEETTKHNFNPCQMMLTFNFWCAWLIKAVILGCGLTIIHNLAQIVESELGVGNRHFVLSLQIVAAVATALGRMISGSLSDWLIARCGVPRPIFLFYSGQLMCLSHLALLLFGRTAAVLYACTFGSAFAFGMCLVVINCITNELYGSAHMGMNFFVFQIAPPLGSLFFNTLVAGNVYDTHAGPDRTCFSRICFGATFAICSGACFFVGFLAVLLTWRTWNFYQLIGHTVSRAKDGNSNDIDDEEDLQSTSDAEAVFFN